MRPNYFRLSLGSVSLALMIFLSACNHNKHVEVREITPPKLEVKNLGKKILCHRPMRNGAPRLDVEYKYEKTIANHYGLGGSGWTLAPGSAHYVNDLLIKSDSAKNISKETPITILGAGVAGLFSAYDLHKRGFSNLTIISDEFENLTSHNAGGLLAPVSMNNAPDIEAIIAKIGIEAYVFYQSIAKHKNHDFAQGAVIVPTYFANREDSGLEPYVGKVMKPAKDVILDFNNGTKRPMVSYDDGIFIDTAVMMESLHHYLRKTNIKFITKKITSFNQVKDRFIINCSGMGAKALNKDDEMVSVQGHLIMLKDQNPKDLQYMILTYFGEDKTEYNQKIKRSFYIFPKHLENAKPQDIGVIGGTFIEGATKDTPNNKEFNTLIEQAKDFYGIK